MTTDSRQRTLQRWGRYTFVPFALVLFFAGGAATAYWNGTSSTTTSFAAADAVLPGPQPTVSVVGSSAVLTWTATTTASGAPVDGYIVSRSDHNDIPTIVTGDCGATVAALTCSEDDLPSGTWRYTVTPGIGAWQGPPGATRTIIIGTIGDGQLDSAITSPSEPPDSGAIRTSTSGQASETDRAPNTTRERVRRTTPSTAVLATPVSANPAMRLVFAVQPADQVAGVQFASDPVVRIEDGTGNLTTSNARVTLALVATRADSGPAGTGLAGTVTMSAVHGLATFRGLSVARRGTFALAAISEGLSTGNSNQFDVAPATPSQLVVVAQPSVTTANSVLAPNVTVEVRDAFDNPTTSGVSVTLALSNNANGATLLGTTTVEALGGTATFSNLAVDRPGTGYTLTATANGLGSKTSVQFDVVSTPLAAPTPSAGSEQGASGVAAGSSQSPWVR